MRGVRCADQPDAKVRPETRLDVRKLAQYTIFDFQRTRFCHALDRDAAVDCFELLADGSTRGQARWVVELNAEHSPEAADPRLHRHRLLPATGRKHDTHFEAAAAWFKWPRDGGHIICLLHM